MGWVKPRCPGRQRQRERPPFSQVARRKNERKERQNRERKRDRARSPSPSFLLLSRQSADVEEERSPKERKLTMAPPRRLLTSLYRSSIAHFSRASPPRPHPRSPCSCFSPRPSCVCATADPSSWTDVVVVVKAFLRFLVLHRSTRVCLKLLGRIVEPVIGMKSTVLVVQVRVDLAFLCCTEDRGRVCVV